MTLSMTQKGLPPITKPEIQKRRITARNAKNANGNVDNSNDTIRNNGKLLKILQEPKLNPLVEARDDAFLQRLLVDVVPETPSIASSRAGHEEESPEVSRLVDEAMQENQHGKENGKENAFEVRGKWIPNKNKKVLLTNMVAKSPCEECKAAKMEKLNWQQKAGEMNARNAVLETALAKAKQEATTAKKGMSIAEVVKIQTENIRLQQELDKKSSMEVELEAVQEQARSLSMDNERIRNMLMREQGKVHDASNAQSAKLASLKQKFDVLQREHDQSMDKCTSLHAQNGCLEGQMQDLSKVNGNLKHAVAEGQRNMKEVVKDHKRQYANFQKYKQKVEGHEKVALDVRAREHGLLGELQLCKEKDAQHQYTIRKLELQYQALEKEQQELKGELEKTILSQEGSNKNAELLASLLDQSNQDQKTADQNFQLAKERLQVEREAAKKAQRDLLLLEASLQQERNKMGLAMSEALHTIVRLSVVAPSFCLNFGKDNVICKAKYPTNEIQNLLQDEVLPTYTTLCRQAYPEDSIESKVADLMQELQVSIQEHLAGKFRN